MASLASNYNRNKSNTKRNENTNKSCSPQTLSYGDAEKELLDAAMSGDIRRLQQVLQQGVNVNAPDARGRTALHVAAWTGNDKYLQLLIDHGGDLHARVGGGWTVLHVAALNGSSTCVQMLYDHGADITAKDHAGQTAFEIATKQGKNETAKLLQALSANLPSSGRSNRILPETMKTDSTPMETNAPPKKVRAKQNHCSRCQCKECINKENKLHNMEQENTELKRKGSTMEQEITEMKRKVSTMEEHMKTLEERECGAGGVPLVVTTMAGLGHGDMVGKDFMEPHMRQLFTNSNARSFQNHLTPQPVIDHMWGKDVLTDTQYQEIMSLTTDIRKANYLWSLMKQARRYLDAVREALQMTKQSHVAALLQ